MEKESSRVEGLEGGDYDARSEMHIYEMLDMEQYFTCRYALRTSSLPHESILITICYCYKWMDNLLVLFAIWVHAFHCYKIMNLIFVFTSI